MPPIEQQASGIKIGEHYPMPIIEHKSAYLSARNTVFQWRSQPLTKELSKQVLLKHGSRKSQHFPAQARKAFGN